MGIGRSSVKSCSLFLWLSVFANTFNIHLSLNLNPACSLHEDLPIIVFIVSSTDPWVKLLICWFYILKGFLVVFLSAHTVIISMTQQTHGLQHTSTAEATTPRAHTLIHSFSPSTNLFWAQAPGTDLRMVGRRRASDIDPDLGELDAQFLAAFLPPILILILDTHRVYIILKKLNKNLKIQFIVCPYVFCLYLYILFRYWINLPFWDMSLQWLMIQVHFRSSVLIQNINTVL